MKTNLFKTPVLSFLGALLFTPLAFAGPSTPGGFFQPVKPSIYRGPAAKLAACCVTHDGCADKTCCTTDRHYYASPSGRGLSWNNVRDCTKTCAVNLADQRSICAKGKGV